MRVHPADQKASPIVSFLVIIGLAGLSWVPIVWAVCSR
jgi:hypothetical protein